MQKFNEVVEILNQGLIKNTEQKIIIDYDTSTINYKDEIISGYRSTMDPFNQEIGEGVFDYTQNPAEPTKPTKKGVITKFVPII